MTRPVRYPDGVLRVPFNHMTDDHEYVLKTASTGGVAHRLLGEPMSEIPDPPPESPVMVRILQRPSHSGEICQFQSNRLVRPWLPR